MKLRNLETKNSKTFNTQDISFLQFLRLNLDIVKKLYVVKGFYVILRDLTLPN